MAKKMMKGATVAAPPTHCESTVVRTKTARTWMLFEIRKMTRGAIR